MRIAKCGRESLILSNASISQVQAIDRFRFRHYIGTGNGTKIEQAASGSRLSGDKMATLEATYAVVCSYLGITSRDLAEIGNFSERFARDLLAGRRPFPKNVQNELMELRQTVEMIHEAIYQDVLSGEPTIYIYRTSQQLRRSPVGHVLGSKAYLGPYRVAMFEVMERCICEKRSVYLMFAETPRVTDEINS